MYLKPLSTARVTITASGPEPLGELERSDHVRARGDAREDAVLDQLDLVHPVGLPVRRDDSGPALLHR